MKIQPPIGDTHRVENQAHPLENYNAYTTDLALQETFALEKSSLASKNLIKFGEITGSSASIEQGYLANKFKPGLQTHDRYGNRIDQIDFHPSYHALMKQAMTYGLHSRPWTEIKTHSYRAALFYLESQVEAGHGCPITMTFSCIPTLRKQPNLAKAWEHKIIHCEYDPRNIPNSEKNSVTIGMAMTEKQGGSDVRANSTKAYPMEQPGGGNPYELIGHKFFVSAPMSDAFLMLAQAREGLSCFLVPRWRPDGSKNPIQIQQLKNKMGNVSNASAETELRGAMGWLIGDEGRGIANILEMVALTRFDCMIGSSAGMRQAVVQSLHHCRHRKAFGEKLIDQPLMKNVLADLALESEAAITLTMRMAGALDNPTNHHEKQLARIGTALGKYWICKRTPQHAYEAMECIGGSGVMETSIMPRLYREAPINAIWEGSGNVQCLDLLRVLARNPECLEALFSEMEKATGLNASFDKHILNIKHIFAHEKVDEFMARAITEDLAVTLQASLLLTSKNEWIGQLFCQSRLQDNGHHMYGTLPSNENIDALLQRALYDF